jgi:hypothetical protein
VRGHGNHFPERRWAYAARGEEAWKTILKEYEIESVKENNPAGMAGYSPDNPDGC